MHKSTEALVNETLVEALETMAFISLMPPADAPQMPTDAVKLRMPFSGPTTGQLELLASEALGRTIAETIFAGEDEPGDPVQQAHDSLRELMNVISGLILSKQTLEPGQSYDMSLPEEQPVTPDEWQAIVNDQSTVVLDADGQLVALRMQTTAKN